MDISPYDALCQVTEKFRSALTELNGQVEPSQIEKLSLYVLEGMSGPARIYHSPSHVLELAEGMDALGTIAALFHDLVYYQVDGGMASFIRAQINRYFSIVNGILHIREPEASEKDRPFAITLAVFGFSPGQQLLVSKGQNEFLSALFALKMMDGILSGKELLAIAVCIEATIPFRAKTTAMQKLEERMKAAAQSYCSELTPEDVSGNMHRAILISNRDVENFASPDPGLFLDETWRLLPEINARLNRSAMYSVREYRSALHKMEGFLSHLDPGVIFHLCPEGSDQSWYKDMQGRAETNIRVAVFYLRLKLYATVLLEALAMSTGGDAPLVYFTGDSTDHDAPEKARMDHYLSDVIVGLQPSDHDPAVCRILAMGGVEGSRYDLRSSPLSAYLYRHLGAQAILDSYGTVSDVIAGKFSYEDFLRAQHPVILEEMIRACSALALTRKERLLSLLDRFGIGDQHNSSGGSSRSSNG